MSKKKKNSKYSYPLTFFIVSNSVSNENEMRPGSRLLPIDDC